MSAKIYSDMRNGCPCGGKFTAVSEMDEIEFPVCASCNKAPSLFRIRAKILTEDLQVKYIDIRHKRGGKRLTKVHECMDVFERVNEEMEKGTFNYRDYDSEDGRVEFLFQNYAEKYIMHHENRLARGELSPSGLVNKKTAIKKLKQYFNDRDICTIKVRDFEEFRDSYTENFRARDLALAELKGILKKAHKDEMISRMPDFEIIRSSNKRKEVISIDNALKVIAAIEDPQYQFMLKLLTVYPIRPGELRALKWSDVNYFGGTITIQRHFSRDVEIQGRKSIKDGDKAEIELPLTDELKNYLLSIPRPLKADSFIFKGSKNDFVSANCLARAWRRATNKLKMPPYELYEMRHARLSQISEQTNGNIPKIMRISGHTNPKTLMERYVRDTSDLKEFFQ